jgi:hypothetical protein
MNRRLPRVARTGLLMVIGIAVGASAVMGIAAVNAANPDVVYACVLNNISQQNVRIVHQNTTCTANEHAVTWNVAGPTGPSGPTDLPATSTRLLYTFVTNQAGFDTGLTISNTATDPFGTTGGLTGKCVLTFYGPSAPTPVTTSTIAPGGTYTTLASLIAPAFQGYMFADCPFPLAHGFAFISDLGARNLAMGYLALVVQNPRHVGESLNQ